MLISAHAYCFDWRHQTMSDRWWKRQCVSRDREWQMNSITKNLDNKMNDMLTAVKRCPCTNMKSIWLQSTGEIISKSSHHASTMNSRRNNGLSCCQVQEEFQKLLICNSEQQPDFQSTFNYIYERLLAMHFYIFLCSLTGQFLSVSVVKVRSSFPTWDWPWIPDFLITFTCLAHRIRHMLCIDLIYRWPPI